MDLTSRKQEIVLHITNLRAKLESLDTNMFSQCEQAHNISQAVSYLMAELFEITEIELEINEKAA